MNVLPNISLILLLSIIIFFTASITNTHAQQIEELSGTYMKSVLAEDDARGNAAGWNPNGIITEFKIVDEFVTFDKSTIVINVVDVNTPGPICNISFIENYKFTVLCNNPPSDNTALHYTVINSQKSSPLDFIALLGALNLTASTETGGQNDSRIVSPISP